MGRRTCGWRDMVDMRDEAVSTVRALAHARMTDSAVSVCMEALRVSEDDPVLECLLARLMLELRAYPEAISAATRAIELDPSSAPAYLVLGLAYDRLGGLADQTVLVFAELAELMPALAPVQVALGEAFWSSGLAGEAVAAWNRALELEPVYARAMYLLAIAALEQEGVSAALPGFRKAADFDHRQDRLFFALAGFDVAGALPGSVDEVPADRASRLAAAGTFALLDEYLSAAQLVRLVLANDPQDPEALALASYCYLKQGAFIEAVACALRALAIRARTPGAVYVLGAAFAQRQALADNAGRVFGALAKAVPDHALPHVLLAEARLGRQAYDEAGGSFRTALELDPGNIRARFGNALVLLTKGRHADAWWQIRLAGEADLERRELFWGLFDGYFARSSDEGGTDGGR